MLIDVGFTLEPATLPNDEELSHMWNMVLQHIDWDDSVHVNDIKFITKPRRLFVCNTDEECKLLKNKNYEGTIGVEFDLPMSNGDYLFNRILQNLGIDTIRSALIEMSSDYIILVNPKKSRFQFVTSKKESPSPNDLKDSNPTIHYEQPAQSTTKSSESIVTSEATTTFTNATTVTSTAATSASVSSTATSTASSSAATTPTTTVSTSSPTIVTTAATVTSAPVISISTAATVSSNELTTAPEETTSSVTVTVLDATDSADLYDSSTEAFKSILTSVEMFDDNQTSSGSGSGNSESGTTMGTPEERVTTGFVTKFYDNATHVPASMAQKESILFGDDEDGEFDSSDDDVNIPGVNENSVVTIDNLQVFDDNVESNVTSDDKKSIFKGTPMAIIETLNVESSSPESSTSEGSTTEIVITSTGTSVTVELDIASSSETSTIEESGDLEVTFQPTTTESPTMASRTTAAPQVTVQPTTIASSTVAPTTAVPTTATATTAQPTTALPTTKALPTIQASTTVKSTTYEGSAESEEVMTDDEDLPIEKASCNCDGALEKALRKADSPMVLSFVDRIKSEIYKELKDLIPANIDARLSSCENKVWLVF